MDCITDIVGAGAQRRNRELRGPSSAEDNSLQGDVRLRYGSGHLGRPSPDFRPAPGPSCTQNEPQIGSDLASTVRDLAVRRHRCLIFLCPQVHGVPRRDVRRVREQLEGFYAGAVISSRRGSNGAVLRRAEADASGRLFSSIAPHFGSSPTSSYRPVHRCRGQRYSATPRL